MRLHNKIQVLNLLNHHIGVYPTPMNINWNWSWGSLSGLVLASQIVTGILLAMHYVGHVDHAFSSVQHLMVDVPSGVILRYAHANGASLFFTVVYLHVLRGLYYSSGNQPREIVWISGVVILLLMVITAFIGYVLPWGQMSFWGILYCPKYDFIFVFVVFIHPPKRLLAKQRIGPHNIDILSIIVGSLLGDSYAEKRNGSTRIHFQQESSNREHLLNCWKILNKGSYCSDIEPKIEERLGKEGKIRFLSRFKTYSFSSFNWIHDAFYLKGKKVVPLDLINLLTPLALAIWIMDDGTWQGSGVRIATNCFSFNENKLLSSLLNKKYNLFCTVVKNGKNKDQTIAYNIYIHKQSIIELQKIVKPFFVKSMLYKIGL